MEIKTTYQDFKADFGKYKFDDKNRLYYYPTYFYYLILPDMVDDCLPHLKDKFKKFGLVTCTIKKNYHAGYSFLPNSRPASNLLILMATYSTGRPIKTPVIPLRNISNAACMLCLVISCSSGHMSAYLPIESAG